jgi:hypothetical protein
MNFQAILFKINKMKNILTTLLFLLYSASMYAQSNNILTIIDSISGKPIPFAILQSDKSLLYTDSLGKIYLTEELVQSSTVEVRCLGYTSKIISKRFSSVNSIFLVPKNILLPEMTISSKTRKIKIGITNKRSGGATDRHGDLMAMFFENPSKNTLFVDKIIIPYFTEGKNIKTKLRIHLFSIGEGNAPGKELLETNIILAPQGKQGKFDVNLEPHNIIFPQKGFFVGLEWILPDNNRTQNDGTKYENDLFIVINKKNKNPILYRKSFIYTKNKWEKNNFGIENCSFSIGLELTEKY